MKGISGRDPPAGGFAVNVVTAARMAAVPSTTTHIARTRSLTLRALICEMGGTFAAWTLWITWTSLHRMIPTAKMSLLHYFFAKARATHPH